jgi:hypothetical protein
MASARAIATRCCWPPDSCAGYALPQTDPVQLLLRPVADDRLRLAALDRRLHDVLQHRHVREEVEPLEDHADVAPLVGDLLLLQLVDLVALRPVPD